MPRSTVRAPGPRTRDDAEAEAEGEGAKAALSACDHMIRQPVAQAVAA